MVSRRRFLKTSAGFLAFGTGLGAYTWQIEPHWVEFVYRPLPIDRLPSTLIGKTLVQLSDIHVGPRVRERYVVETFARVRALAPDVVVYTGDMISHAPGVFAQMERVYAGAPTGRLATFASLGNHDYGRAWRSGDVAGRVAGMLTNLGATVLRNSLGEVEGLQVVGLDDIWARRFDARMAFADYSPTRPGIVLSHNPDTVDLPGWDNYHGWILSGHTHGGQCKPPFLPPPLLPVANRRYTAGEFSLSGDRMLYINRGVGHVLQARFNVRPEVTIYTLVAA